MTVKPVRLIFIALLFLSLSISISCYNMANVSNYNKSTPLIGLVPQRLRLVLAGILWDKADEYMHFGPSLREKTNYTSGSFAGNTELVALLSLAIELAPNEPHAYPVLTQNLAKYLGRFTDSIRILQYGIHENSEAIWVHELYAEVAFQYVFDVQTTLKNISAAQKYINKAIEMYPADSEYKPRQKIYTLKNYLMFKSRITEKFIKLSDEASDNNKVSDSSKALSTNLSVEYDLRKPKSKPTPIPKLEPESKAETNKTSHSNNELHKHTRNCIHNKANTSVSLKMRLIYSFLLLLSIVMAMFKIEGFKKSI